MHILNVIQCTNLGGMEQSNLLRLVGLQERGHQCSLLSLNPLGALQPELQRRGISAEGLEYRGWWGCLSVRKFQETLRTSTFDGLLMTGHNLMASVAILPALKARRVVLSVHFHHTGVKPAAAWRLIYRVALMSAGAVTFPCAFIRTEAEAIFPPLASVSHVVPNPFEIPHVVGPSERAAARTALNIPEGAFVIGNAGWLIQRKRFDMFLSVARRVLGMVPDALFVIAGDGPEKSRLKKLAEEWGLGHRILWLGWLKELRAVYQSLDVLLFNSDWDALGRTPLEALSFGIPVVASVRHGGLSEILLDGKHGFVFPNHDIEEMAKAIVWCSKREGEARAMALAGREHLSQIGSISAHAATMERLLGGTP